MEKNVWFEPLEKISEKVLWEELLSLRATFGKGEVIALGTTVENRKIPCFRIGNGNKRILYVGGHHGAEWITATVLLFFLRELCAGIRVCNVSPEWILQAVSLTVLPLLNVDGAVLQSCEKERKFDPFYEFHRRLNLGNEDFSRWQANGRGVDLNHNYDYRFSEYKQAEASFSIFGPGSAKFSGAHAESEPETHALADLIRNECPTLILSLHTQGEEIFAPVPAGTEARGKKIALRASRLTGYRLTVPEGTAAYGGLCDWSATKLGIPSLTLECGKGSNPLPPGEAFGIYQRLRELLFVATTF